MTLYRNRLKRPLDLASALVGLIVLSPLLVVLSAIVLVVMGPPILFRQSRPGLYGKPFTLLKFRTMSRGPSRGSQPLSDADRLTWLGRALRSWSLDELPELFNVLRGEMSLVGPRPLLPEYLELYTPAQARRHDVRPGITGWAQVHGRNALNWEERFRLDVWYVDNVTLGLDARILGRTLIDVLKREGIAARGHATMPPFKGSASEGGRSA